MWLRKMTQFSWTRCKRGESGVKLFRKNIEPSCTYCQRGQQINETDVMCVKHGIVAAEHHCRSFKYDPLKRVPPRPAVLDTAKLKEEDFSL